MMIGLDVYSEKGIDICYSLKYTKKNLHTESASMTLKAPILKFKMSFWSEIKKYTIVKISCQIIYIVEQSVSSL